MNFKDLSVQFQLWLSAHTVELVLSLSIILIFLINRKVIRRLVRRHAQKNNFDKSRILYVTKITGLANFLLFTTLLGLTWEISLSGLSFYFASIFTVVGVALFANWSILSNMTASVILFFFFPYKIGSKVKIQDGDNSIEGLILDIKMFYIEIEVEEGRKVSYPNNLAIQKPFFNLK